MVKACICFQFVAIYWHSLRQSEQSPEAEGYIMPRTVLVVLSLVVGCHAMSENDEEILVVA